MKILIVEDDPGTQRLLMRCMKMWGYDAIITGNGQEAFELICATQFPIMLTDWMLPGLDGISLVKKIRELPQDAHIYTYVILFTARDEREDLITAFNAGVDDFLRKPIILNELQVRLTARRRILELEQTLTRQNQELALKNLRMQKDLEAASHIQKALLPSKSASIAGLHFAWLYKPCTELGGDIFNIFQLNEKEVGFFIIDVCGHGSAAALLAVSLSLMLNPKLNPIEDTGSPLKILSRLNDHFQLTVDNDQYFTILYGVLHISERRLRYATAGHPGLIIVSENAPPQLIERPSVPIGFLDQPDYEEYTLFLNAGDRIYLLSDGVTDSCDANRVPLGAEKLMELLFQNRVQSLAASLEWLQIFLDNMINAADFNDDISIMALEIERF